jgi:chromosome segregation ATPase
MKSSAVRTEEESGGPAMSETVESRIARIESHVEHIDAVTTDLRVELRRTNDRMDAGFQAVNKKIDDGHKELNKKIDEGYQELNKKIDEGYQALSEKIEGGDKELRSDYKELNKKVDDGFEAVNKKIDDVHHRLKDKLHSMAIWALLLYVTLAGGLLTVIARSFKWF